MGSSRTLCQCGVKIQKIKDTRQSEQRWNRN